VPFLRHPIELRDIRSPNKIPSFLNGDRPRCSAKIDLKFFSEVLTILCLNLLHMYLVNI
jgi:hypothetical protein